MAASFRCETTIDSIGYNDSDANTYHATPDGSSPPPRDVVGNAGGMTVVDAWAAGGSPGTGGTTASTGGSSAGGAPSGAGGSSAGGAWFDAAADAIVAPTTLRPLNPGPPPPNAFHDIGKSDLDVSAKITSTFNQLFHGDSATQTIYYPYGSEQAFIRDTLHDDIRTEGIGLGMMITVELGKRDEFDRLWRYAKKWMVSRDEGTEGYFSSRCAETDSCLDPFGLEEFTMALILANDKWGRGSGNTGQAGDAGPGPSGGGDAGGDAAVSTPIDYAADAVALLNLMRHGNGIDTRVDADRVTTTFDTETMLVFNEPVLSAASFTRPALEMPAYYDLWAQATGDPFWTQAAAAGRGFWKTVANGVTGLTPVRANLNGTLIPGDDDFAPEAYRTNLNIAIDRIWFPNKDWVGDEASRLLQFFAKDPSYGRMYSLDGKCSDVNRDLALVAVNGALAAPQNSASSDVRKAFANAVWNMDTPTGQARYYSGILEMISLLILSGQFRIF